MRIDFNDESRDVPDASSVSDALTALGISLERGMAVAINEDVVPRAQWDHCSLREGDKVLVITATQGG